MKRILKLLLLTFLLNSSLFLCAQNVVIDAEIRPRTEFRDGFKTPILSAYDPGIFTSQRTRLGFTFTNGLLTTQITVQDARVLGQFATSSSDATIGIYEAWADMLLITGGLFKIGRQAIKYDDNRLFSAPAWSIIGTTHDLALFKYSINDFQAHFGRQAIKYDDNRLFSAPAWSIIGTTHDLALFKYSINDFQAHLGLAYNNNKEIASETFYTPGSKYRSMGFLWLSSPVYKGFTLTGIVVDEGLQDTLRLGGTANYKKISMNQAITYGGNLKYENSDFPLSGLATAYFQTGKSITDKTLEGKLLALKLNYSITKTISASLGTDYISGDNDGTTDGIQSNFKKLYGADHTFNGYMDYWNTPLTQGLLDYYGSVTGKISKSLTLEGGYHVFNSEFAGKNKKGVAFAKDLGSEFDFLVTYKLNSWTTVQGGYCRYFSNINTLIAKDLVTNATTIPEVRSPQWAYIMFTIKPTFLNTATAAK